MDIIKESHDTEENLPPINKSRYAAVKLLSRFERSDSYIDKLLAHAFSESEFSPQDKALLTELVNGVIRWRGKLDWALTGFYHGDYLKCLNIIKNAMRVGLYQVMFLDRVPAHAAINDAVEIVKRIQGSRTAGMVNAVLRNITRNMANIRYPSRENDPVYYLAVIHSHPKWMVKRWMDRFGYEATENLLIANNRRPYVPVRVNTLKASPAEISRLLSENSIEFMQSPYLEQSFLLQPPKFDISQTELFKAGKITVQDTAASLAVRLASPEPGSTVIDMCSAPGGKTVFMAELMKNSGSIIALDKYQSKIKIVEDTAARMGFDIIETRVDDSRHARFKDKARVAFCDVPCSGLGTLSKKPDIKWKREPEDIASMAVLQLEIAANAAKYVDDGGWLVYSTCTTEPEENEENIARFLAAHPDFELDPAEKYLPAEVCSGGMMKILPHVHGIDGAFAARLRKR